ncbi:MAG: Uma2 family endonuclease [Deltaproteobacteria bacterium]|nr:Uma2 family endonuclease [Deltaproteobacteria bacterium]
MSTPSGSSTRWVVDPRDPRAPPRDVWESLSPAERAAIIDALPSDPGWEVAPPEGDDHYEAADGARKALRRFFGKSGRRAYVGTNLSVYYPNERVFAPDLLVVLDVDPRPRAKWVVAAEGRGLDFALEIHVAGDWRKDFVANVERYARLGIPEYFAFNLRTGVLVGHRLAAGGGHEMLSPGPSGFASEILGLELFVEGDRVRFFHAGARLPELDELVGRLESAMSETLGRLGALERELEEERAARDAERAARDAAEQRVAELERQLAERKKP